MHGYIRNKNRVFSPAITGQTSIPMGVMSVYVFHGLWEEKISISNNELEVEPLSRKQRLQTVIEGKRNLGQKILGVSVLGPKTFEEAKAKLIEALSSIIIPSDA